RCCRAGPPICLRRAGDPCVLGAVERAGNTLYGARVYVKLGRISRFPLPGGSDGLAYRCRPAQMGCRDLRLSQVDKNEAWILHSSRDISYLASPRSDNTPQDACSNGNVMSHRTSRTILPNTSPRSL